MPPQVLSQTPILKPSSLTDGLVWVSAPGISPQEIIGQQRGILYSSATFNGGSTLYGKSAESTHNTDGGIYWNFDKKLAKITDKCTILVIAQIDSAATYGRLFGIPYRNDGTWAMPFSSLSFLKQETTTGGRFEFATDVANLFEVHTSAGYLDSGTNNIVSYLVTRNGTAVRFYKNGAFFEAQTIASGNVDFGAQNQDVNLLNSTFTAAVGRAGIDGKVFIGAVWNRVLNDAEVATVSLEPSLLFNEPDVISITSPGVPGLRNSSIEIVKISDFISITKTAVVISNHEIINTIEQSAILKNFKSNYEIVKLSDRLVKYFNFAISVNDKARLLELIVRLPIRLRQRVLLSESVGAFIPRERPANDIINLADLLTPTSWKLFGETVKLRERLSVSVSTSRSKSEIVKLSESAVRSVAINKSKSEIIKIKDLLSLKYTDLTYDFWSEIVLTKQSQSTFNNRFTIYSPNLTQDFWSEIYLTKQALADFAAQITFYKTRARFFGQGGRGILVGGNYSVCPTPSVNGSYINDTIGLEILSDNLIGSTYSWSIRATSDKSAKNTLERISIRIANQAAEIGTGVAPFDAREYIYITSAAAIARAHVTGTYNKTIVQRFTPASVTNDFAGSFANLADGKYQLIVEAVQALSGNKYILTKFFEVGGLPYDIEVDVDSVNGQVPLTVNFTSARSDGDAAKTKKIIWEFEPGKRVQFGDTSYGRNPSYVYKTSGLYMPIVTYVLDNGYEISRTVSPVYEESI